MIELQHNITELDHGIILPIIFWNHIIGLYYGIMLRNFITGLYYGIVLRDCINGVNGRSRVKNPRTKADNLNLSSLATQMERIEFHVAKHDGPS